MSSSERGFGEAEDTRESSSHDTSFGSQRDLITRRPSSSNRLPHVEESARDPTPYASGPGPTVRSTGSLIEGRSLRPPLGSRHSRSSRYINPRHLQINTRYDRLDDQPRWGIAQVMPRVPRDFQRTNSTQRRSRSNSGIRGLTGVRNSAGTYVDSEYEYLNPHYGRDRDEPQWGLASVFPHVVDLDDDSHIPDEETASSVPDHHRWCDRRSDAPSNRSSGRVVYPAHSKGETEAAPQINETSLEHISEDPSSDDMVKHLSCTDTRTTHDNRPYHRYNFWSAVRYHCRNIFAEVLGTTMALVIGISCTLSTMTSSGETGNFVSRSVGFGLGFMIAIYVAGGASGAHFNPVISINLAVWRGFSWSHCAIYILSQLFGSILAGLLALGIYQDAIKNFDEQHPSSTFSTVAIYPRPQPFTTASTRFFNEFLGTAVMVCSIFALGDDSNVPPGAGMHAFIIGLLVIALTLSFGYNTSGVFNPVRDLGPRIASVIAGDGAKVFSDGDWFWLYGSCIATITGGLLGGFIYDTLIYQGGESPINFTQTRWKDKVRRVFCRMKLGKGQTAGESKEMNQQQGGEIKNEDIKMENIDLERGDDRPSPIVRCSACNSTQLNNGSWGCGVAI